MFDLFPVTPFRNLHASSKRWIPVPVNSYKLTRFSHAQVQSILISIITACCSAVLACSIAVFLNINLIELKRYCTFSTIWQTNNVNSILLTE